MRWQILLHLLLQFISECNSERIVKIGQSLPKLAQKVCVDVFFDSQCTYNYYICLACVFLVCGSGGSSGSAMYCALQAAADYQLTAEHRIVVILPDSIRNYMYEYV